MKTYSITF